MNRGEFNVMVTDAHALGMIAVIRSLGRAGYRVHAVAGDPSALGLKSRYCARTAVHPTYRSGQFAGWLADYVARERIAAIVPSEGFYHACGSRYPEFAPLIPDAVDAAVWQRCMSKVETFERLRNRPLGHTHLPPTGVVRQGESPELLSEVVDGGPPFYVKGDAALALSPDQGATVVRCESEDELRSVVRQLLARYRAVLYQGYSTGHKVGVSLWRHDSQFRAENMTLGLHMSPYHGGMMTLRRTFWHNELLADAKAKMELLDWQGVAMMEYKWDREREDFRFIEINARYWGYLHLDLFSGVDFPRLQIDAHLGAPEEGVARGRQGVTCRHVIPGEYGYLTSLLRSRQLSAGPKLAACLRFLLSFLNPFSRADLLFPGDRGLYWRQWYRFGREQLRGLYTRLRPHYRSYRV